MAKYSVGQRIILNNGRAGTIVEVVRDLGVEYANEYSIELEGDEAATRVNGASVDRLAGTSLVNCKACGRTWEQYGKTELCVQCARKNLLSAYPIPRPALAITQVNVGLAVAKWITEAESQYGGTMKYSQDLDGTDFRLGINGFAEGFTSKLMSFTPTVLPSIAIQQFFDGNLTVCECHGLMMAVFYRAILDLLGDTAFDRCFAKMKIEIGAFGAPGNPLWNVTSKMKMSDESDIQVGDWVYFRNKPEYKTKHPLGNAAGWNVVCVSVAGGRRYIGFGLSGGTEPLSEVRRGKTAQEITTILLDELKKPATKSSAVEKHVDVSDLMRSVSKGVSGDAGLDRSWGIVHIDALKLRRCLE